MKRNLLTSNVGLFSLSSVKLFTVVLTFFVLLGFGTVEKVSAQCIGPYQGFVSNYLKATMQADGWLFSASTNSPATVANCRTGIYWMQVPATGQSITTPLLATPDKFQFYYRSQNATNFTTFIVECSMNNTFPAAATTYITSFTTNSTTYVSSGLIDLSSYSNIYVRLRSAGYTPMINTALTTGSGFTPLSGGTTVAINSDNAMSGAIPIGFPFAYNGNVYTNVYASSNGFLSFNPSATSSPSNDISNSGASQLPLVAPLWDDLDGTSGTASYSTTTGAVGTRIFTFEWLNWEWGAAANTPVISFQVKLYEASGRVEFIYRTELGTVDTTAGGASVGITGNNTGEFYSLNTLASGAIGSKVTATNNITVKPTTGQIYGFNGVTGVLWIDDFSWTSKTASQNLIIVPETGNSTCIVTVPSAASGTTYKFYDQGGSFDIYTRNQTQTMYFAPPPASGEKVQLTYKAAGLDNYSPLTSITIYNGRLYTSAAGATSSGATITVGSTANLTVGMLLGVSTGVGAFSPGTVVASVIDATTFTASAAPTAALSGGASVVIGYNSILGTITSSAYPLTNTTYTSTDSSGYITVVISNTISLTALATSHTGFDFDVKCVAPPTITNLLTATSACPGTNLTITGTNLTGATFVTIGIVAATIVSNTATQIVVTPGATTTSGNVVVTTSAGIATSTSTYTVNALPTVSWSASGSQTLCVGGSPTALSVTAAAGSGTITTYQWYSNTTASTTGGTLVATNNSIATTDTYTPSAATAGTLYYYVVVTNSNGCVGTSSVSGAITVNGTLAITTNPSTTPQSVCVGGSITPLTVSATGGSFTYQWFSNTSNLNSGGTPTGVITSSYTPSNLSPMSTTYYYCVVSGACSSPTPSDVSGGITVNAVPTAVTVSGGGTVCTSATLTASNGGSGTIYWQNITSNGTSTLTPSTSQVVNASGTYYFRAYNGTCWGTQGSATVSIVTLLAAPGSLTSNAILSNGFTANWNVVTGATGGYFIDVATDVGFTSMVLTNFSVGNVTSYAVTGLNPNTIYYWRVRGNDGTCSGNSSSANCTTLPITYCTPTGTGSQDPLGITNFTMGTINNTSALEPNNYGDYTVSSTNVLIGASVPFSVTYGTGFTYDTSVWVDWNNDGDFLDSGEQVYTGMSTALIPATLTGTIAIPLLNSNSTSTLGLHRLRIGGADFGPLTDPCRSSTWQAFEDYTINVIPVPPCAVSIPSGGTAVNVTNSTATLVWSDPAMTPNTVYNYWVINSSTPPPTDCSNPSGGGGIFGTVTGALSANITTGLNNNVTYNFWIRVKCSSSSCSVWIGPFSFLTQNLDVITMSNGSIQTCNAKFYDDSGFGSNYSDAPNGGLGYTYTITPNTGKSLKVVFNSFQTEGYFDGLTIYNGPDTTSPIIPSGLPAGAATAPQNSFYGTTSPGTIYSPVNGSLTFKFTADGSVNYPGWDATVTCVDVPVIGGFSPSSECVGATSNVIITGSNFASVNSVKFNGVSALFTVSGNTITATLPSTATTGLITVSNSEATGTSSIPFLIKPIPVAIVAGTNATICSGQTANLSLTPTSTNKSLATTQGGTNSCSGGGNMFDIVVGGNPITISSFDIKPNITGAQSVNVYYRVGTYDGNETNSAAWTLNGTYNVTGVSGVIVNMPIANLNIPAGSTYGIYINYNASYTTGSNTYSNTDLTINAGTALCGSFSGVNKNRTFNGAVNYSLNVTPTYAWSPSTGLSNATATNPVVGPSTVSSSTTTSYTVTTTVNGCTSPSSNIVTVTVNPTPTLSVAAQTTNNNCVIPVLASGATSYSWSSSFNNNTLFSDSTGSSPYVGANIGTIYVKSPSASNITVTGTNTFGCSAQAIVSISANVKTHSGGLWNPAGPPLNNGSENIEFISGTWDSTTSLIGSLNACSCKVSGATVSFNNGHNLSLLNGLTVTSGSMTFNDGASLIQTNEVANSGNIVYKRNSTPCFKYDYSYWSSPVASQTLIGLSPGTSTTGFFDYNSGISFWQQSDSSLPMTIGKGYLIRVPSSYPVSPASPQIFTANYIGVPNNGTIPLTVNHNTANQLNLIGNPYPSALNAYKFVTDPGFNVNGSFLDGTIYLWTHNSRLNLITGQYAQSDYAIWNVLGGTGTAGNGGFGSGNTSVPNGNIASGQGFFINTKASGTAYFRNSMRTGGATNTNFYRTSTAPIVSTSADDTDPTAGIEKHRIWLDISDATVAYKQLLVGYIQDGTDGFDRLFDGRMVDNGNQITLYTKVDDEKLSIQGRGLTFTPNDVFALGYKSTVATTYTINLSDFDGLFTSQDIYLEDKLLTVIHDLKSGSYTFATEAGTFEDRFVLRFTAGALGVPVFTDNTVVVYKNEGVLTVNSGAIPMKSVEIYDVTGRLITAQKGIYATQTRFTTLPATNQVLLVQITSDTGVKVTKKVVY